MFFNAKAKVSIPTLIKNNQAIKSLTLLNPSDLFNKATPIDSNAIVPNKKR